jgi:hypothetical protein
MGAGHQGHQRDGHARQAHWCSHSGWWRRKAPHHERKLDAKWNRPLRVHEHGPGGNERYEFFLLLTKIFESM